MPLQGGDLLPLGLTAIFAALITLFPIRLWAEQVYPFHTLIFGTAVALGPTVAGWAALLGLLIGVYLLPDLTRRLALRPAERRQQILFNLGWHLLPTLGVARLLDWQPHTAGLALPRWTHQLIFIALSIGLQIALQGLYGLGESRKWPAEMDWQVVYRAAVVHLMPLPFVWGLAVAVPSLSQVAFALMGGLVALLAVLAWGMGTARVETDRRQQEIRTIERVGRTLRDSLELEDLLNVLHRQVTQVIGVDNFYVALLDPQMQRLWYPLAVKHGQRQQWPRRPLADRLTDRVILHGQPILLPRDAGEQLAQIGLPAGEEAPSAWLGVPLITQGRTIGCLAVFATSPDVTFDVHNLELLNALSGQVSVAIQNALMYRQAQRRAEQLEQLTEAGAAMTASLNLSEVQERICQSAAMLSGAPFVAIFQLDESQQQAFLTQALGFSARFRREFATLPLKQQGFSHDLLTSQPLPVTPLEQAPWEPAQRETLKQEGMQAAVLLPLRTPRMRYGVLLLGFQRPITPDPDELHLLQTFASQATLALANARLYAQTDSALRQRVEQLSILEAIGRELSAAIRSAQVFDMVLQYATDFTRSSWGLLSLYDETGEMLKIHTVRHYPEEVQPGQAAYPQAWEALHRHQVVNLPQVRDYPRFVDYTGGQVQSHISVPLIHEDRVLGVISLESARPAAYGPDEEAFLRQLANQAAIALVNARLYRESQARLEELELLYQTGIRLSATVDEQTVLDILAQSLLVIEPRAQVGMYRYQEGEYRRQVVRAGTSHLTTLPERILPNALGPTATAMLQTGPLYLSKEAPLYAQLALPEPSQVVLLPLKVAREPLGLALILLPEARPLEADQEQMLHTLSNQGALALHNAVLFGNVRQVRDRLVAVLNAVGDGVLMVQSDGRIALANAPVSQITGQPLNALIHRPLQTLPPAVLHRLGFNPETARRLVDKMESSYAPTTPRERYRFHRSGQEFVMDRITAPVMNETGQVIGWVVVLRDVTEQVRVNQTRELIAETLVHDLRSPLSAIISALDLLEMEAGGRLSETGHHALHIARRSASRLVRLMQSLLEISRMEAGALELHLKAGVDVGKMLRELVDEFRPQAVENGLLLQCETEPNLPPVPMDEDKISRVLINLIDNALKFTPEGGRIEVSATVEAPWLVFRVRDTGPGIPPDFLDRIFDRFVQVPGRRGRRRGVGIGLTFSRLAVEAHGGQIAVRNHPDGGAEFTIRLPLQTPENS